MWGGESGYDLEKGLYVSKWKKTSGIVKFSLLNEEIGIIYISETSSWISIIKEERTSLYYNWIL